MDVDLKPSTNVDTKPNEHQERVPLHPTVAVMVQTALSRLHARKGTSYFAIKKFISDNYNVNMNRITPFVKRHIKKAVHVGNLKQMNGRGMVGRFKIVKVLKSLIGKKSTWVKKTGLKNMKRTKSLKITIKKTKNKYEVKRKTNTKRK